MKIIIFSSYPAIWSMALAEATLAHALQKSGNEVVYITPGNEFTEKSNVLNENILRGEFGLRGYDISKILTNDDRQEISRMMDDLNQNNFENLIIDNINIGKIALYEFLLDHKKMTSSIADAEWSECVGDIKNTLISFLACKKIIEKEKPDSILMYNTLYSVNNVWKQYAHQKNVDVYFVHHGANVWDRDNTLIVAKNNTFYCINALKQMWSQLKNSPVSKETAHYITNHFLELMKGKHYLAFSTAKSKETVDMRKLFGISENQKILTATMSSYDEIFAAEYIGAWDIPKDLIFAQQVD